MGQWGKILIFLGLLLAGLGAIIVLADKWSFFKNFPLGKLPGDIYIQKENFTFYFPVTSGILVSVILTALISLFNKFK